MAGKTSCFSTRLEDVVQQSTFGRRLSIVDLKICLACATERLETKDELQVHVKKVLSEFQALLSASDTTGDGSCRLCDVLTREKSVFEHLCGLLFSLLLSKDVSSSQLSLDVLMLLLEKIKMPDMNMPRKLMERAMRTSMVSHNFPTSLPLLTFLGRLLHSRSHFCSEIISSFGSFFEFLIGGLTYPDESVKSAVVYILSQVVSNTLPPPNSLPLSLIRNMCRHISTNLANSKSKQLTANLLSFIQNMLKTRVYTQCLLEADGLTDKKGSTLASAFKRLLLSHDELLQLSGSQCIAEVLLHHHEYGRVLLTADIAEFMFEALSSKNEQLLHSLFSCLDSLAGIDDFYSKCHTIYGIDPVFAGLTRALKLRNYSAGQLGFSLLSQMLSKQPRGMPLLTGPQSLSNFVELTGTALQAPSPPVVLQATLALSNLLSVQHIPRTFSLDHFLPLMALLLHQLELLMSQDDRGAEGGATSTSAGSIPSLLTPQTKKQITASYVTLEKFNRLVVEYSRQPQYSTQVTQEVIVFLYKTYEESVIPPVLFYIDELTQPEPFISTLSIASCLFSVCSKNQAHKMARKLALAGFIQLTFDLQMKFYHTRHYRVLSERVHQFLVSFCFHLEQNSQSAVYVRDLLQATLPLITCSATDCLQFLSQRTAGLTNLNTLQSAVLALFYYAHTHVCTEEDEHSMFPRSELKKALSAFLSLNPNIHLLPPTTITHLTVLYVHTFSEQEYPHSSQLLVRGLQIAANPEIIFVPHSALLKWAFSQRPLLQCGLARKWLTQWLKVLTSEPRDLSAQDLIDTLSTAPYVLTDLLDIIADEFDNESTAVNLLELVISKSTQSKVVIVKHIQSILLAKHLEPVSDFATMTLLKLLLKAQESSNEQLDAKLIYQIANVVIKVDDDCTCEGDPSPKLTQHAMELLSNSLAQLSSDTQTQVPIFLLSNTTLVQKVATLSCPSKDHTELSTAALQLIVELMESHYRLNIKTPSTLALIELDKSSMISALSSPLVATQVAGLHFWRVVFVQDGETGCFLLKDLTNDRGKPRKQSSGWTCIKVVLFLVENLFMKDVKLVCENAALCFTEAMRYISERSPPEDAVFEKSHHWHTSLVDYVTDMYNSSTIPLYYLPCLAAVMAFVSLASSLSSEKQNKLAQLLFKTHMSYLDSNANESERKLIKQQFQKCFEELHSSLPNALSDSQWSSIAEKFKF